MKKSGNRKRDVVSCLYEMRESPDPSRNPTHKQPSPSTPPSTHSQSSNSCGKWEWDRSGVVWRVRCVVGDGVRVESWCGIECGNGGWNRGLGSAQALDRPFIQVYSTAWRRSWFQWLIHLTCPNRESGQAAVMFGWRWVLHNIMSTSLKKNYFRVVRFFICVFIHFL